MNLRMCMVLAIGLKLSKAQQSDSSSDDPNYTGMVQLQKSPVLNLYYEVVTTDSGAEAVSMKAVYQGLAWLAIGINPDGQMIGGEVIIGQPSSGSVDKYTMTAEDESGVTKRDSSAQTLISSSITQDGSTTTLEFTKLLEENGEYSIDSNGLNTFIYATGSDNTFPAYHSNRNSFQLNLSSATAAVAPTEASTKNYAKIFAAHGIMAVIAWAFLTPFAVASTFVRSLFSSPLWFKLHMYFNCASYLLTFVAFILAVVNTPRDEWFENSHFIGGWFLMGLATLQVVAGIVRPKVEEKKAPETVPQVVTNWFSRTKAGSVRAIWEGSHRFVGIGLMALSLWQMQSGLKLLTSEFGMRDYLAVYWFWICCLLIALLLVKVFALRKWTKRRPTGMENNASNKNNIYMD